MYRFKLNLRHDPCAGADVITPPASGGALPRPDALFTPTEECGRPNGPQFVSFVSIINNALNWLRA